MVSPEAEVEIDAPLVRALLAEQHPDLADLPLRPFDEGWDNALWRVGDELLARLPRRAAAAGLVVAEQRWLPELAPALPLPIPVPVRVGRPSADYPWSWSVVPHLGGEPADRQPPMDADAVAIRLGGFLRALHVPAPPDAPRNPYRGVPLSVRTELFEQRMAELGTTIDGDAVRAVWEWALAAPPPSGPPVWLHGDPHPANLLIAGGTLAAVVDFGDLCAGDPATDLAGAWMLLPSSALPRFVAAYAGPDGLDPDLERRALGWAVVFGVLLLAIGLDDRPTYAPIGHRTLGHAVAHASIG